MSEKLVKQSTIEASGNQLHNTTRGFDLCSVISHIPSADPTQALKILTLPFLTHIVPLQLLARREA
jgi:hypothetical protein